MSGLNIEPYDIYETNAMNDFRDTLDAEHDTGIGIGIGTGNTGLGVDSRKDTLGRFFSFTHDLLINA